jgi:hypothetical protein
VHPPDRGGQGDARGVEDLVGDPEGLVAKQETGTVLSDLGLLELVEVANDRGPFETLPPLGQARLELGAQPQSDEGAEDVPPDRLPIRLVFGGVRQVAADDVAPLAQARSLSPEPVQ